MSYYNLYFSPTGGTKKVSDAITAGWGEEFTPVDLMRPVGHRLFRSGDLCLFAVPSYGGRVPAPAVERIRELSGNGAAAVLIAVFGNRAADDTLPELSDELEKAGFRPVAAVEAAAQHSLMPRYGAGRPDAADRAELKSFAERIRGSLEAGGPAAALTLPGSRPYRSYSGVPLKPHGGEGCIGCGICAEQCPTGAISPLNYRMTDGRKCISCMHCVEVCPPKVRRVSRLMLAAASAAMKKSCSGRKENKLYL